MNSLNQLHGGAATASATTFHQQQQRRRRQQQQQKKQRAHDNVGTAKCTRRQRQPQHYSLRIIPYVRKPIVQFAQERRRMQQEWQQKQQQQLSQSARRRTRSSSNNHHIPTPALPLMPRAWNDILPIINDNDDDDRMRYFPITSSKRNKNTKDNFHLLHRPLVKSKLKVGQRVCTFWGKDRTTLYSAVVQSVRWKKNKNRNNDHYDDEANAIIDLQWEPYQTVTKSLREASILESVH